MPLANTRFELCPPTMDKGWSFQIFAIGEPPHLHEDIRPALLSLMQTPLARQAKPFLQGDCVGWLMVEFHTDNESVIAQVASFFESSLSS